MNRTLTRQLLLVLLVTVMSLQMMAETTEKSADGVMVPHLGKWTFKDDTWATAGDEPPGGWYLRSLKQYDLSSIQFAVKKDKADGLIYLYTDDWRVLLKKNCVIVKYAARTEPLRKDFRRWQYFWYGIKRPITFEAGNWHKLRFALDGKSVVVYWDGKKVVDWQSPDQEWGERIRNSKLVGNAGDYQFPKQFPKKSIEGKDQLLVLHSYLTGAAFKDLKITGNALGPAKGYHTASSPAKENGRYHADSVIKTIIPHQAVDVKWKLDTKDAEKAAKLPMVNQWEIPPKQMEDLGSFAALSGGGVDQGMNINPSPEYRVGVKGMKFPKFLWGPRGLPRKVSIYFNLAKAGEYTFINDGFSVKRGPTPLEIRVDGKPVSRLVYRPMSEKAFLDHIPLKLEKGPHMISMEFLTDHVNLFSYIMKEQGLTLGKVALVPGIVKPVLDFQAGQIERNELDQQRMMTGEYNAKEFILQVSGLVPGKKYKLKPLFFEVEAREPGVRLMDLYVNGKLVTKDLDIFREAGWIKALEKEYEATALPTKDKNSGTVSLRLAGKNNKAFINALKVVDDQGKTVFLKNWSRNGRQGGRGVYMDAAVAWASSAEPPKWEKSMLFDGHNRIANPHFSLKDPEGLTPLGWHSLKKIEKETRIPVTSGYFYNIAPPELREAWDKMVYQPNVLRHYKILQDDGDYCFDPIVGHLQPGSLEIGKTGKNFGVSANWFSVDYGKHQEFSFWVKTDQVKGVVTAEIYWLTNNMFSDLQWQVGGNALPLPMLVLLGKARSEKTLSNTHDWTRISVTAKPPYGTSFAIPVVRVSDNSSGYVWVDDAEFDGYSAEPLEISYSFLGYHPKSDKHFVVKSLKKQPVTWTLVDKNGKTVKSGTAKYHNYEWFSKRYYYTVDLTGFETPGEYKLRVKQDGLTRATDLFKIDPNVYRKLCDVALHGLYNMRYNIDIPDLHEPECLEDGQAFISFDDPRYSRLEPPMRVERKNGLYGYYDAGDQYKKPFSWPGILMSATCVYDMVKPAIADRTKNDALDEMAWGYKTCKIWQNDDGTMPRAMLPQWHRHLDNIPRFGHDRVIESYSMMVPSLAGAAAMGAYLLKDKDKEQSDLAKEIAIKNYTYNFDDKAERTRAGRMKSYARNSSDPSKKELFLHLGTDGKALLAEIYLYKLTGDETYKKNMERHVKTLCDALKQKAYRMKEKVLVDRNKKLYEEKDVVPNHLGTSRNQSGVAMDFVMALCHFARNYPNDPLIPEVKKALRTFADDVKRVSKYSPYGQARDLATPENQEPKRWTHFTYPSPYWMMLAYNLAEIGIILDDPEIVRLAERQMQWLLGKNVADASVIHGVGKRAFAGGDNKLTSRAFMDSYLKGDSRLYSFKGMVPSLALRDVGGGGNKLSGFRKGDVALSPVPTGVPKGYLRYWLQGDTPQHPGPTESFTCLNSPMVFGAAGIQAAMQYLDGKTKKGK